MLSTLKCYHNINKFECAKLKINYTNAVSNGLKMYLF